MALSGHARIALRRAGGLLAGNRRGAAWAVVVIAAAVLGFGAVRLAAINIEAWATRWRGGAAMVIYLDEAVAEPRARAITDELAALPGVVRAEYVAPAEASRRLRAALGRSETLLDGVPAEAMPATVELVLEAGARDVVAASPLFEALHASDSVDDVDLDGEWVDQLAATIGAVRGVGWALALLLAVCAALNVAGAVRLTLAGDGANDGDGERAVARLLGAGRGYFAAPAVLAGLVLGALGATVGLAVLTALIQRYGEALAAPVARALGGGELTMLPTAQLALIIVGGAALGALGGALAGARRGQG